VKNNFIIHVKDSNLKYYDFIVHEQMFDVNIYFKLLKRGIIKK